MADTKHLEILEQGVPTWNQWRQDHPELRPNLREAQLSGLDLHEINFNDCNIRRANLSQCDLSSATFRRADLRRSNLSHSILRGSDLTSAILIETNLEHAVLSDCLVYGVSAWNLKLDGADQKNLIVSKKKSPILAVDDIEVAQFVHLIINNRKIRDVISTVAEKAVLILGRFSPPERKSVLDSIAAKLRDMGFLPIVFDFEGAAQRDFTETIRVLAGLSLFVIADITKPRSSPLELQATVPDYKIPFVPILQAGEVPFSMFRDLNIYDWVLKPIITYQSKEGILEGLEVTVIRPALQKHRELLHRKEQEAETRSVEDVLKALKTPPSREGT